MQLMSQRHGAGPQGQVASTIHINFTWSDMLLRLGQQVLCCQCHLLLHCLPPAGLVSYGHEAEEGGGQVWWLTTERGADTAPK